LIERTDPAIKVPHMGWNDVELSAHPALIEAGEAYFLHSYHFAPDEGRHIAAMTDHGGGLVAAVARDNVVGVQFHPEKSQAYGLGTAGAFSGVEAVSPPLQAPLAAKAASYAILSRKGRGVEVHFPSPLAGEDTKAWERSELAAVGEGDFLS
jgi:hypothetical protein